MVVKVAAGHFARESLAMPLRNPVFAAPQPGCLGLDCSKPSAVHGRNCVTFAYSIKGMEHFGDGNIVAALVGSRGCSLSACLAFVFG